MAFRFVVLCAALACANAGFLGARIAAPALAYGAAPALAYGAAAPTLGSTFHGNLAGSPAVSYAAPAVSYAAPALSYAAPALSAPAITSQHSNIIRSFGNLGQVSTYSKSIDTPFSSVRKHDIRVSNPGVRTIAAAPALAYGAAPAISTYHGSYAAPAIAAPVLRSAYAAPAISAYHGSYAAPAISAYHGSYAAPAIAAPVLRSAYAAPAISAYAAPALSTYGSYAAAAPVLRSAYAAPVLRAAVASPAVGLAYSAAPAVSHLNYASAYANYGW